MEVTAWINSSFLNLSGDAIIEASDTSLCGDGGIAMILVGYEQEATVVEEVLVERWAPYIFDEPWYPHHQIDQCYPHEFRCRPYYCCHYEKTKTKRPAHFIFQNTWGSEWADGGRVRVEAGSESSTGFPSVGWCRWKRNNWIVDTTGHL